MQNRRGANKNKVWFCLVQHLFCVNKAVGYRIVARKCRQFAWIAPLNRNDGAEISFAYGRDQPLSGGAGGGHNRYTQIFHKHISGPRLRGSATGGPSCKVTEKLLGNGAAEGPRQIVASQQVSQTCVQ